MQEDEVGQCTFAYKCKRVHRVYVFLCACAQRERAFTLVCNVLSYIMATTAIATLDGGEASSII